MLTCKYWPVLISCAVALLLNGCNSGKEGSESSLSAVTSSVSSSVSAPSSVSRAVPSSEPVEPEPEAEENPNVGDGPPVEPEPEGEENPNVGDGPRVEPEPQGEEIPDVGEGPPVEPPTEEEIHDQVGAAYPSEAVSQADGQAKAENDPLEDENPNVGPPDDTPYQLQPHEVLLDPAAKGEMVATQLPIVVQDKDGNALGNVGISIGDVWHEDSETPYLTNLGYQGQTTRPDGSATVKVWSEYSITAIYLYPPQENARARCEAGYQPKFETFVVPVTSQETQEQMVLTLEEDYTYPDAPVMELTILDADGVPCADYWCMVYPVTNKVRAQSERDRSGWDGITDENGKASFYGARAGEWSIMAEPEEVHLSKDNYHYRSVKFNLDEVNKVNQITIRLPD